MVIVDIAARALFGAAGIVSLVAIVWEVYRHWPDIVRLMREADAPPTVTSIVWRTVEREPVDFILDSTNTEVKS